MAFTVSFKLITVFLLWVCLALPSTLAKEVTYCDKKGNYAVKVTGVEMSPDPVKAGKEAIFQLSAITGEDLSEGEVIIDVSYFGLPVHTQTIDLCEETSCPVAAGNFVLSHSQTLPLFTPPGTYTLKMRIQDSNKYLLTCISFSFNIALGSSVSEI